MFAKYNGSKNTILLNYRTYSMVAAAARVAQLYAPDAVLCTRAMCTCSCIPNEAAITLTRNVLLKVTIKILYDCTYKCRCIE